MYVFNYDTFYKYYTNNTNLTTGNECFSLYMFPHTETITPSHIENAHFTGQKKC